MTTMAVLNHAEEELDDDIVSNLSLNLMVSDNEDGGSPTSDRFDKVDSRNESPEDSNTCDNSEESKMAGDDNMSNNEMKDDLQRLRDITGDSSWSAVDESDAYDFSIDIDNAIPTKTENKSTSIDKEPIINENDTTIRMDEDKLEDEGQNKDPAMEVANTNEESDEKLDNQSCPNELEENEEMENEERLLNDVKDSEKETEDCENLDEDALLSDPRDEDLLQITEEKSTENDNADFLRCCQEEQEANENSCSSTEKGEDNHSESTGEYEESNTDAFESDDTITNENYENGDMDNDTSNAYDLNLVKCEGSRGEVIEDSDVVDDEMNDANVTENLDSSKMSVNNVSVLETNGTEYLNVDAANLLTSENNLDETEQYTEACENEIPVGSSDNIERPTDTEHLDNLDEDYENGQSTENDFEKETNAVEDESQESKTVTSELEASTKKITITEVISCGDEGASEESNDMMEATEEILESTEEVAEECNNIVEASEGTTEECENIVEASVETTEECDNIVEASEETTEECSNIVEVSEETTEECDNIVEVIEETAEEYNIEATTDPTDEPKTDENDLLSSAGEEPVKSDAVSNNIPSESEVSTENEIELLPDILDEDTLLLPLESTTKDDVHMEGVETEQQITQNDILMDNQVEINHTVVVDIANDSDKLLTEDTTNVNDGLTTEDITITKEVLADVEDLTIDNDEPAAEDVTIENEELAAEDITIDREELVAEDITATKEDLIVEDITISKEDLVVENNTDANEVAVKDIAKHKDDYEVIEVDSAKAVSEDANKLKETDDEPMEVDDMDLDAPSILSSIDDTAPCITNIPVANDSSDNSSERNEPHTITINDQIDVEGKTDTITDNREAESITDVKLILDDTKPKTSKTVVSDENIINLIDDGEPEIIDDSDATKLQNKAVDGTDIKHTMETAQLHNLKNTSGIEGDNKECEDMDIEEITPYKESVTRPNGSVLKQILVTKNISSSLCSTSPMFSLPTTDGKQNTKTYFIVSPISNTIADNNIAVVSPQPGEKRLSSDNFQSENAKRRRLATPGVREAHQKYLEHFKQAMASTNWSRIGRRQLEEFATQKLLEAMHYKTGMGELHKKCTEYKQSLENLRTNSLTLTKQLRDMNSVHIKLEREINILKARHRNDDKPLVAVKITRSVGLQAMVEDPKIPRRRSTNAGSSARASAQKQAAQAAQQQQTLPPQLQQKPMIQQQQQQQQQVQVPQRVVMATGTSPQLQQRPAPRPLQSHSTVATPVQTRTAGTTPVQTRTMSRNKKVQIPTVVTNANPPPLRSISQQQQQQSPVITTIPTSIAMGIPIKNITGPTILNKSVGVPIQSVATPIITKSETEVSKGVIDLTDEDDVGKKVLPVKNTQNPQAQQQQRITLMSTVVNGQQVLLRVDGGGPIPSKAGTPLTNGTPLFVQSPMMQQRVSAANAMKVMAGAPLRTRTTSQVQTPTQQANNATQPANTAASPTSRRFRHPAPLPAPPSSQSLIKGNKPIPPKPTVTVNKSPNGSGIILKWNMPSMLSLFEKIVRYELFVYQVTKSPPRTDSWGKINDVGALDLPMAVSLTEFAEGNRYYFAVRAVDELGRLGPFSEPQTIVF